jgi:sugar-specific transcriptional regulator TrmB
VVKLNRETLSKALVNLGLSETDAEVYVFLAVEGPQKGKKIAEALNLYKQQLYRSLKSLRNKGMVNVTPVRPALFSAVPLEKVTYFFVKAKVDQAKALQEKKEELLATWKSILKKESGES